MREYGQDTEKSYNTANSYFLGEGGAEDKEAALLWYEDAATKGHVAAQYSMGLMYRFGQGVEKNPALAAEWFEKAAAQGYRPAYQALAELYYKGGGRDPEKAHYWYDLLAEENNPSALYNLGNMHANGDWVRQSAKIADHYYKRAASLGHIGAKLKLEKGSSVC